MAQRPSLLISPTEAGIKTTSPRRANCPTCARLAGDGSSTSVFPLGQLPERFVVAVATAFFSEPFWLRLVACGGAHPFEWSAVSPLAFVVFTGPGKAGLLVCSRDRITRKQPTKTHTI